MKAHIEALSDSIWLIRVGSKFETFGDPYEAVCTFVKTGPTFGMVVGLAGSFNRQSYQAIKKALVDCGIEKAVWERIKDHGAVKVSLNKVGTNETKAQG